MIFGSSGNDLLIDLPFSIAWTRTMHSKIRILRIFLLSEILLFANAVCEWPYSVRFIYSPLNGSAIALLAITMPILIMSLGNASARRYVRFVTVFFAVALMVPALLFSAMAIHNINSDQLQASLAVGSATYRIYTRDGDGAFSQPVTILRKEIDAGFGIKLVRTIWTDARYGQARLRLVNGSTLEIEIDGDFFKKRMGM